MVISEPTSIQSSMQLSIYSLIHQFIHSYCSSSYQGVVFGKETRQLVANLTIGSSDIQPPGIYHYLPHIIGKPQALAPQTKISKGRIGGEWLKGCGT